MKKYFLAVIPVCFFLFNASAQVIHPCAAEKLNGLRTAKTSQVDPSHTTLENKYDVKYYQLDIALERTSIFISGNVLIRAQANAPMDIFAFELHPNLSIDSVKVNGVLKTASRNGHAFTVALGPTLPTGTMLDVRIYY
jgi:hypothetical protein